MNNERRTTQIMFTRVLYYTCLIILVLVFSYTGMIKYIDPVSFSSAMHSQPFSDTLTQSLIHILPPAEIATAVLVAFDRTRIAGLTCALLQLLVFTIYTIMVLLGHYAAVPCPCGGFVQELSWQQHLLFNIALLCTAIVALVLHRATIYPQHSTKKNIHGNRECRKPV